MCFQLYVGTAKPIPRRKWSQANPEISVVDLNEQERSVQSYFSKPEVQYIGSTSCCGCDFPHLMFQNGGWPGAEDEKEPDQAISYRRNQEALVGLLRDTTEKDVELYGVWSGDFSEPKSREEIWLTDMLKPDFYFKEQGFYRVRL